MGIRIHSNLSSTMQLSISLHYTNFEGLVSYELAKQLLLVNNNPIPSYCSLEVRRKFSVALPTVPVSQQANNKATCYVLVNCRLLLVSLTFLTEQGPHTHFLWQKNFSLCSVFFFLGLQLKARIKKGHVRNSTQKCGMKSTLLKEWHWWPLLQLIIEFHFYQCI